MPSPWEISANTFSPERRRRYADEAADRANVFRRDGFAVVPPVPVETVNVILAALEPRRGRLTADVLFHYDPEVFLAIAELKAIALRPDILCAAAVHLGAPAKIIDVSLWRTRPGDGGDAAAQRWHRDVDDWRACKLFVYLTDVGPEQGPHMFVPGSHRVEFFEVRDLPPDPFFIDAGRGHDDAVDAFPRMEIMGPPGTAFLENTYGFHKGKPVVSGERVLFQVCYGLMDLENMFPGSKIPAIRKAWG